MKHNPNLNTAGTYLLGTFRATYSELVDLLGEPSKEVDEYKVSTEWCIFAFDNVYTIYDYKMTNLYDEGLPSPQEFRAKQHPINWHIGGRSDYDLFVNGLANELDKMHKFKVAEL